MTAGSRSFSSQSRRPYGNELAANYGAEEATCVVTRSLPQAELAVTEIKVLRPFGRMSDPLPRQDAYMIVYELEKLQGMQYWEEGRHVRNLDLRPGETTIHDLRREPAVLVDGPLHTIQWFVPHAALNALADEANVPHIEELRYEPGVGVPDEIVGQMNVALLPALRAGEQVSRLFVDHVNLAFAAHVAEAYGGMQTTARLFKGGLAPWQERQAKEMLLADLTGAAPLAAIAAACGLSASHFARAFRRSTGLPPHAWLNQARVERAMILLRQRGQSLSEIALECGFVDQSHFTRVFVRHVGLTPGAWRRMVFSDCAAPRRK
jgi:AraC family transcriptional regulator